MYHRGALINDFEIFRKYLRNYGAKMSMTTANVASQRIGD